MSVAAIVPALKIIGGVMAAKSAIEGLKEGNLLQAALGGAGAYMAFSGLGAVAGSTGDVATAGLDAAKGTVEDIAAQEMASASTFGSDLAQQASIVSETASPSVMNAASGAPGAVTDGVMDKVGSFVSNDLGLESAGDWLSKSNDSGNLFDFSGGKASDDGFMDNLFDSDYTKGQAISGAMNLGGSIIKGNAMEDKAKWELEQQERLYEEQRKRRASVANTSFLDQVAWDPVAGQYVAIS